MCKEEIGSVFLDAIKSNDMVLVRKLIEQGLDLNMTDITGKTPLMYAILNENLEIINLLLELKADINIEDDYGHTALDFALERKNNEIADILKNAGAAQKSSIQNSKGKEIFLGLLYGLLPSFPILFIYSYFVVSAADYVNKSGDKSVWAPIGIFFIFMLSLLIVGNIISYIFALMYGLPQKRFLMLGVMLLSELFTISAMFFLPELIRLVSMIVCRINI